MLNARVRKHRERLLPWRIRWGRPVASVTINGVRLLVDVRDTGCGRILYLNEEYELPETAWVRHAVKPGMIVVDIGAHVGYYTTLLAQMVGPTGRVVAVEPDPHNFRLLQKNVRRNKLRNVQLFPLALGDVAGKTLLYRSSNNHGDHRVYQDSSLGQPITVQLKTLDEVVAAGGQKSVDIIKIDVQGFEPHVLAGAGRTLKNSPNLKIMTEFWPYGLQAGGSSPKYFFDSMTEIGFSTSLLSKEGMTIPVDWKELHDKVARLTAHHPDVFTNLILELQ